MKKTSILLILLTACSMFCTSCLGDTEETDLSAYDDAAIIAFSLGTLNKYTYTKGDDGLETLSKTTYNGADYKFYIDHDKGEIYNPDSLPYGTDAAHVLCVVTSKNSGYITLLDTENENTMLAYSSSDSINFTTARKFVVTSLNGERQRQYTVKVNVHQQEADKFYWSKTTTSNALASLTDIRSFVCGNHLFLVGAQLSKGHIYTATLPEGKNWQHLNTNIGTLPADISHRIVTDGTSIYMLKDSEIWKSEDGANWTKTADATISTLIGATTEELYAISSTGTLVSSADMGQTWEEETLDHDATLLPTADVSMMISTLTTNAQVKRLLLVGHRDATTYATDLWAQAWSKIIDPDAAQPWMYYTLTDSKFLLPMLKNLQVVSYGSALLAIGGAGEGASTAEALSQIYYSPDSGVTWMSDDRYTWPSDMNATEAAIATDSDNFLWVVCSGSGQVWRGRLTQLGWEAIERAITE